MLHASSYVQRTSPGRGNILSVSARQGNNQVCSAHGHRPVEDIVSTHDARDWPSGIDHRRPGFEPGIEAWQGPDRTSRAQISWFYGPTQTQFRMSGGSRFIYQERGERPVCAIREGLREVEQRKHLCGERRLPSPLVRYGEAFVETLPHPVVQLRLAPPVL